MCKVPHAAVSNLASHLDNGATECQARTESLLPRTIRLFAKSVRALHARRENNCKSFAMQNRTVNTAPPRSALPGNNLSLLKNFNGKPITANGFNRSNYHE